MQTNRSIESASAMYNRTLNARELNKDNLINECIKRVRIAADHGYSFATIPSFVYSLEDVQYIHEFFTFWGYRVNTTTSNYYIVIEWGDV